MYDVNKIKLICNGAPIKQTCFFFVNFVDNGTEAFVRGPHSILAGFWYYNLVHAHTIAPAAASN